mgnify:CR=1 FL=1
MSESQSRYSIVERLTAKKLELIYGKASLQKDYVTRKQHAEDLTQDFKSWKV